MPRNLRPAAFVALVGTLALAAPPTAHASVLFVLDGKYGRILWFDAKGTHTLAPFKGRTNLLSSPKAIATDAANELVVLNGGYPELVDVDVRTGEQFEDGGVAAFAFGAQPDGLAIDPRTPALLSFPTLYVGAVGELDTVSRTILTSSAALLGSFPTGYELASSQYVATHDPGSGPVDVFASTDAGILGYDGSQTGVFWVPPQGSVMSLDGVDFQTTHELFFSYQFAACPSDYNGIYFFDDSGGVTLHTNFTDVLPFATGGNVACPGAIALTKNFGDGIPPTPVYVVDRGSSPQRIFVIYSPIENSSLVATLPADADAVGLVVYSPEPKAGGLGAVALGAVAALGLRRGARRRSGRSPAKSSTKIDQRSICPA
jgi:hypothetical protein